MSSGLYSGVSGLALGTGLYRDVSGLWSGASGLIAGFDGGNPYSGASLYLDFLTMTAPSFDTRITFSRGSNATLTDSTGKITYAPANLLTYSEQFDNAAWVKTAVSATANSTTAPDGTNTADTLAADGTASPHNIRQTGVVAGFARIFFTYAKAGTSNFVQLYFDSDAGPFADFDLATGIVGTTGSNQTASITSVGDGWYRCAIYTASTTATTPRIGIISSASAARAESNSLSTSIYVWGAQLEPVTYQTTPSTYQATTSSAYYGPRFDYDPVTLAAKGLLVEEQRANLLTYSSDYTQAVWTKSLSAMAGTFTTDPAGTNNGAKWREDNTTNAHQIYQAPTLTAAAYTESWYLKAAERTKVQVSLGTAGLAYGASVIADLSAGTLSAVTNAGGHTGGSATITALSNGWYRVTLSVTATATTWYSALWMVTGTNTTNYTGDGTSGVYIWGAQLEEGSFATSYIPTVASTVTRSADVATMTGSNFSAWFNGAQGTFVVWFDTVSQTTVASRSPLDLNSSSTLLPVYIGSGGTQAGTYDGVRVITATGNVISAASKVAMAYSASDSAITSNGGTVATGAAPAAAFTSATSTTIGGSNASGRLNGHVRSVAYYNVRLPNAQLQSLTA